mgnify:CR=1 FL=1
MDIWAILAVIGIAVVFGWSTWLQMQKHGFGAVGQGITPYLILAVLAGIGILLFVVTGGGPEAGLLSIPIIVVVAGILLWRFHN